MATFRGLLVRTADQLFVIPTAHVERVVRIRSSEIRTAASQPPIALDERVLALVWLEQIRELPARPAKMAAETISAVVLGSGDRKATFWK